MKRFGTALLLVMLSTGAGFCAAVRQIGPDLYAYISTNDASANSTFLVTPQGILVVDTGVNDVEGRKLLAEIRKISGAPVRYVVNTHYHGDHTGGNAVVGPDATVISTSFTRQELAKRGNGTGSAGHQEYLAFRRSMVLHFGGHEIDIYFPGPAHTMGDAVVYFPDQHAVATGDLFLNNSCPAMDEGSMENWIVALDRILSLPVEHVVPGHFELGTKTELRAFRDYLVDLRDQVSKLYNQGEPVGQVQQHLRLDRYRGFRQFPKYQATFADNAATYYHQLEQGH